MAKERDSDRGKFTKRDGERGEQATSNITKLSSLCDMKLFVCFCCRVVVVLWLPGNIHFSCLDFMLWNFIYSRLLFPPTPTPKSNWELFSLFTYMNASTWFYFSSSTLW